MEAELRRQIAGLSIELDREKEKFIKAKQEAVALKRWKVRVTEIVEKIFAMSVLEMTVEGGELRKAIDGVDEDLSDRRLTPEDISTGIYDGAWLRYGVDMRHTVEVIKDGATIGYVVISDALRLPAGMVLAMEQPYRDRMIERARAVLAQRDAEQKQQT